jgi:hypothetical protein
MAHVRTIAHLANLPDIHIFYCAPCQPSKRSGKSGRRSQPPARRTFHKAGWTYRHWLAGQAWARRPYTPLCD